MNVRNPPRRVVRSSSAAETREAVACAYRDLAIHVRRLRDQYGLSQRALAQRMTTNERAIRRIERRQHNVTIKVLVRLALALDVGVQELLAPVKWSTDEDDQVTDVRNARPTKHRAQRE